MTITSLYFFVFLMVSVVLYYVFPKKYRWISLLAASLFFFLQTSLYTAGYFLFGTLAAYICTRLIDEKCKSDKSKKITLTIGIACEVILLFILKYINLIPNTFNAFGNLFNLNLHFTTINLIAPIGISYYSLSIWSYMVDVYRTAINAEKNYFKLALFACYYPCLVSGPIIRYPDMKKEFFEIRKLDWDNIFIGSHRIIYGLLKKMVIADHLAIIVNAVFDAPETYSGILIILGVIMYAVQIYCDFSGCMDIIIGASKLYGIKLPENFESPFFSRNLSEFWRRWHITLGQWGKDYIMYPLLKSEKFQKLGKKTKKKFGKKIGKKIPAILSIFVLWLIIGIWHGASYKYIFAAGILPWIYFSLSELFSPVIEKFTKKLNINTKTFGFHLFQSCRTLFLMLIIWFFALAPSFMQTTNLFKCVLHIFNKQGIISFLDNYLLFGSTDILEILLKYFIIVISAIGLILTDYLKYTGMNVGERFNKQPFWFRYIIIFGMIGIIMLYGVYGPGYNSADFIYGGF